MSNQVLKDYLDNSPLKSGVELIAEERKRQIDVEGWTQEHDSNEHQNGELAAAGACYALWWWSRSDAQRLWPFDGVIKAEDDVPYISDKIRAFSKAGALIAAEIDRLQNILKERPKDSGIL